MAVLVKQIQDEKDSAKFNALVGELNKLLEAKSARIEPKNNV